MSELLQAIILVTVESLCCKIFFDVFLEKRYPDKKIRNTILFLLLIGLSIVLSILPIHQYIVKCILIIVIISSIMGVFFKGSAFQIIFCALGFYGILLAIDKIMLSVITYLVPEDQQQMLQEPIKATLIVLICKSVLFLCIVFLNRRFKKESSFYLIADTEWLKFLFFPFLTIITMLIFVMNKTQQEKYLLLISVGLIFGNFMVFYMIKSIVYKEKKVQSAVLAQERTKNQTNMYIQIHHDYEEQKLKIHEFKNHMNCIQGLLEVGQQDQALKYVKNINETWIEEMNYVVTNNQIVNAVLNEKYKKAKMKHIPVIMSINNLETFNMQEEDIVTLLANLLENAIEAVEKKSSGDRSIKFKMVYEGKKLEIVVRNPIKDEIKIENNQIQTSKKEKENHGIGLINIERVIEKYDGKFIVSCKDGYFTSTVVIRNT